MKLKELPASLFYSAKLRMTGAASLTSIATETSSIVVSLTSIESRLATLDIVIKSLLRQSLAPAKIVLWLHESLQEKLPRRLAKLRSNVFDIRYVSQTSSHKKLVYSLQAFPDSAIVVCDDDFIYPQRWLEFLAVDHAMYPHDIIANAVRKISYADTGELLPYKQWRHESRLGVVAENYLGIGYGGVLYPADCFVDGILDRDLYLKLTPRADDLWFKMMSYRKGVLTRRVTTFAGYPIPIAGTQGVSLKKQNVRQDYNREQWQALCDYFAIEKI